eukprot:RCo003321
MYGAQVNGDDDWDIQDDECDEYLRNVVLGQKFVFDLQGSEDKYVCSKQDCAGKSNGLLVHGGWCLEHSERFAAVKHFVFPSEIMSKEAQKKRDLLEDLYSGPIIPNLVRYHGYGERSVASNRNYFFVFERMECSLRQVLDNHRAAISPFWIEQWANHLLLALQALAAKGFVHGDLKPENLALSKEGVLNIIDVDTMVRIGDPFGYCTKAYAAPEQLPTENPPVPLKATSKTDVWAVAVVLLECCLQYTPTAVFLVDFPWQWWAGLDNPNDPVLRPELSVFVPHLQNCLKVRPSVEDLPCRGWLQGLAPTQQEAALQPTVAASVFFQRDSITWVGCNASPGVSRLRTLSLNDTEVYKVLPTNAARCGWVYSHKNSDELTEQLLTAFGGSVLSSRLGGLHVLHAGLECTLAHLLEHYFVEPIPLPTLRNWARNLVSAVRLLEQNGWVHG